MTEEPVVSAGDRMFWNTEVAYKYRLSSIPAYEDSERLAGQRNKVAYAINLPCALNLTDKEIEGTCDILKSILPG
jgi:hypothetical protein